MQYHQIQQNQEIVCLNVVALSPLIRLITCFSSSRESFKLSVFFAGALLFPITLVIVTSPASDLLSAIFLLLPTMFSTPSEIVFQVIGKMQVLGRHLSFGEDWKGVYHTWHYHSLTSPQQITFLCPSGL